MFVKTYVVNNFLLQNFQDPIPKSYYDFTIAVTGLLCVRNYNLNFSVIFVYNKIIAEVQKRTIVTSSEN
jgi:hypothetical protein